MSQHPELSIITVNYNGQKDTCVMIESLLSHLSFPYELIVVDNGSRINEATILQKKYPFLRTIRSDENLGFAGGNNVGIKAAKGEFILFLNNDAFVRDGSISRLIEIIKDKPHVGGISPKIVFSDPKGGIQFAGYTPLSKVTLRNRLIGFREVDNGQYNVPRETPYLHGAAMLVRRDAIEKAGLMPELYFLYYEEIDWSLMIRRQGYTLEYHPTATIYHNESSSTGQGSPLKAYFMTRNRLLFARRNLGGIDRFLSIFYQMAIVIPKGVITSMMRGRLDLAKAMLRGCKNFVSMREE